MHTEETQVAESNNEMDSVAVDAKQEENVAVTSMGQPSEVSPPINFTGSGGSAPVPAAMRVEMNHMLTQALEHGSNRNSVRVTLVVVNSCEDILEKLIPYAAKKEIFILGATGVVSYVELLNPQEALVANTVLQGHFEIASIEGNIVLPEKLNKNKKSLVTVLVAGNDGRIRGGPVRSLIAKSSVQVVVSTTNKNTIYNMACKEYSTGDELPIEDQAKRMTEVVDKIYKATLKELNETNV
ncbi:uncharacterized protein LOC113870102 [Abrus precatorius]|uniref:AT-hook motif nuclear-localized protein n=1 Tax=Abrus precatorius TaxID=3816 RepID=A0A8B8M3G6_ABRPR|nr:uncharacterized protein LOC113870102 [Abrus precatorius]